MADAASYGGNTAVGGVSSHEGPEQVDPSGLQAIFDNTLAPATIHTVELHGAKYTRRSLLDYIFKPLVESSPNATLGDVVARVGTAQSKLSRLGIFKDDSFQVFISDARKSPAGQPETTELDIAFNVKEKSRLALGAGTDIGNTEGSAYTNAELRNIFGGAETLTVNARTGTRTRSAYNAALSAPVLGNPDIRAAFEAQQSSTSKPWASHEENITGGSVKVAWQQADNGDSHSVTYSSVWRQLTNLLPGASPTVRGDAGDSLKNSFTYSFTRDRLDRLSGPVPTLPQSGYLIRAMSELAGWGFLKGDVAFSKTELELSTTRPLAIPGVKNTSGITVGGGFRMGLLYPLPFSYGLSGPRSPSRINDRFQLGGPTDVRGFKLGGLGPHDNGDAVGGDVYAAGGVNMMLPIPRVGASSPLRIQLFANGGRLVALKNKGKSKEGEGGHLQMSSRAVSRSMRSAVSELADGLPSMAAGVGLVYAHPAARFELNFSLPLAVRKGEEGRKGLQVGVGINFL
ncbi:putative mitochondrial outer membrane beta-barrel protein [Cercophora newfieldiana]|uniref:Mitochondrial outer membrane beta-barrel protein n=1 Tax=Cercophora newfieldiana TaxID=92897 RepID=A0AA40CN58_9PEZI|nr:putative mitochondrial outer membrane beta-barrel protein [Cercophora newfieldiana]